MVQVTSDVSPSNVANPVGMPTAPGGGAGAVLADADAKDDPKGKAEASDAAAGDMGPDAPAANSAEQTIPSTVPSTLPGGK